MSFTHHNLKFFEEKFGDYRETSNPEQVVFCCPDCGKEKLYAYLRTRTTYCWVCARYNSYREEVERVVDIEELKRVRVKVTNTKTRLKAINFPKNYRTLDKSMSSGEDLYLNYLVGRGFTEDDIRNAGILFGHMRSTVKYNILLPVFMDNVPVYYTVRNIGYAEKPYLNPDEKKIGNKKSDILFNYDTAKLSNTVIVFEGIFDAMTAGASAVATLGKHMSRSQFSLICSNWKTVVLGLDPDAIETTLGLYKRFRRVGKVVKILDLIGYKDANEAGRDVLVNRLMELEDYEYKDTDMLRFKARSVLG